MAGDWIKVQTCTPDKPEVHQMAEALGIDPDAVMGKLIRIWAWADMHTIDGNAVSVTKTLLDRITSVTGFSDALSKVGWLELLGSGVHFTNFDRHNGDTAKTRALTGKRVAKSRLKDGSVTEPKRNCNGDGVTESLPEKRRVEKRVTTEAGRTLEHIIPKKLDDAECHAAAAKWFAFLESKGLDDKNPDGNEIALEEWWRQMGKLTRVDFLEAVSESIAAQRWNVTKNRPRGESGNGKTNGTHLSPEFLKAYDVFRKYTGGDKMQIRKDELGPILYEAGKRTTAAEFQRADDSFGKRDVALIFEQHLATVKKEAGS